MDPTKPILDIYNNSYYNNKEKPERSNVKATQSYPTNTYSKNTGNFKHVQNYAKKSNYEPSYSELKDKYQQLYQAYHEKAEKLNYQDNQIQKYKIQVNELRREAQSLRDKNEDLQGSLMEKNMQLEDCYRKLQSELKNGSRVKTNDNSIDRLQDGLKQAIESNFQLLKQSTLSELRQYIP